MLRLFLAILARSIIYISEGNNNTIL